MKFWSRPLVLLLIALAGCGLPRLEKGATCRAVEAAQPVPQSPYSTLPISRRPPFAAFGEPIPFKHMNSLRFSSKSSGQ
jgi:hypothetical protein